ncbi:MAG: DUF4491 family protein [Muribaculaceae bacterium]|nr:DUF4491 family protein [Muribaculaceae bacterium]
MDFYFISLDNFIGLLIGLFTFLIIGLYHPLVIKGEYYFGEKVKWWFLVSGIIFLIGSILIKNQIISILLGVASFSSFWSIKEVVEQVQRVEKGWFPAKHKRKND